MILTVTKRDNVLSTVVRIHCRNGETTVFDALLYELNGFHCFLSQVKQRLELEYYGGISSSPLEKVARIIPQTIVCIVPIPTLTRQLRTYRLIP